jgi:putative thioredoxin
MYHPHHDEHPYTFNATEDDFQDKVIQASQQTPIMVDFWADWCSPCHALAPVLDRLVKEDQGRWLLAKVEVDDNMRLAGHYKLRGFPTVLLFIDGEVKAQFSSARSVHWVRDFIEQHVPPMENG